MANKRKQKFKVGQVVKLTKTIIKGGFRIVAPQYVVIESRGISGGGTASFLLPFGQISSWVSDEEIEPLTKKEAGR